MVDKVRERLTVNKQRYRGFNTAMFNLKKLNAAEGKEKYRVEVSNRFAALEDLDAEVEINSAWETIREKNGVFWIVTPCGSCNNRRFGGTWRLLHQGDKNR
jgi:hypothetical protein